MPTIEIDDGLYLRALNYVGERTALGIMEEFPDWLEVVEVFDDEADRRAAIDGLLAAIGDDDGDYRPLAESTDRAARLRQVVWSFHSAWVDRFGVVPAISRSHPTCAPLKRPRGNGRGRSKAVRYGSVWLRLCPCYGAERALPTTPRT
jgi:hypothetical protein